VSLEAYSDGCCDILLLNNILLLYSGCGMGKLFLRAAAVLQVGHVQAMAEMQGGAFGLLLQRGCATAAVLHCASFLYVMHMQDP
jgi:hypothetical protein